MRVSSFAFHSSVLIISFLAHSRSVSCPLDTMPGLCPRKKLFIMTSEVKESNLNYPVIKVMYKPWGDSTVNILSAEKTHGAP